MAPSLRLENVGVGRGGQPVLEAIDLAFTGPGILALMGASGIGKTTLLQVIAGLIPHERGSCKRHGRTAMIFQDPRLLDWQSARDNAAFGLRAAGMTSRAARRAASRILDRLGISGEDQLKYPAALSGGMRQRVAVARALATEPDILLMDEPFTSLDANLRNDHQGLVREIVDERGIAAVLVTHDPLEAVKLADRIIVLGGAPARVVADLPNSLRNCSEAELYRMAGDLMARAEIAAAFAPRPKGKDA